MLCVDLQVLNYHCISALNPTWSRCVWCFMYWLLIVKYCFQLSHICGCGIEATGGWESMHSSLNFRRIYSASSSFSPSQRAKPRSLHVNWCYFSLQFSCDVMWGWGHLGGNHLPVNWITVIDVELPELYESKLSFSGVHARYTRDPVIWELNTWLLWKLPDSFPTWLVFYPPTNNASDPACGI